MAYSPPHVALRPAERSPIGLIGLGRMGLPITKRLIEAGFDVTVWNRSSSPLEEACAAGAAAASTPADLFASADTILLTLANGEAADAVLGRRGDAIAIDIAGKLVIQLGTTSPSYSQSLAIAITRSRGRYIEAPVSGSRIPAERGTLVAMLGANSEADFKTAEHVLACLTSQIFRTGSVPSAMNLKLAVNAFLVPMVSALGEAWQLSKALGLDCELFRRVLDCGPMASEVSRIKLEKLVRSDFTAQASIDDVKMNAELVLELGTMANCPMELVSASARLLRQAQEAGLGELDMIGLGQL